MYKKLSIIILVIAAIITGLSIWRLQFLAFDYNFENFFPRNDKDTEFFKEHRKRFGTDNDYVLIGLKNSKGIFQKDFLEKVHQLEEKVKKVENVVSVVSPLNLKETQRDPLMGSMIEIPYLRYDQPENYAKDSVRIFKSPQLLGSVFSRDGKSVCVMLTNAPSIKDKQCIKLDKDLREILSSMGFEEYHLAGRSISQAFYTQTMKIDLIILLLAALAVIITILALVYRKLIGIVMPFIVVGMVVVWSMAFMEITGKHIDVLSNAIPTILVVTGLSVAIHVITKYIDHLKEGWTKVESLKYTITHVGLANVFTTITTVVGFASLATSGIKPIDDFGLYTAMGVALSFVIGYTVLPALLYLVPAPKNFGGFSPKKVTWEKMLYSLFSFIMKFKRTIVVVSIIISAIMLAFTFRIKENTFLLEDLNKKDPMKIDFLYFEHDFQGTRPFEMSIQVKGNKTVFDRDVIVEMDKIETYLHNEYKLGFIVSPIAVVKGSNQSLAGGAEDSYVIPESNERYNRIIREIKAVDNNDFVKSVVTPDYKIGRLRSIMPDIGSNKAGKYNDAFKKFFNEKINKELIDYHITGTAELIDKNNRNLSINIAQGMVISFVLVSIIFLILFKNWKMIIIAIVPNIVPLLVLSGTMGMLGISMKMSTAILFTIAFGIAVDDTIHFLSRFRTELKAGKSILYAIKRTYMTSGKAMIITTLILCIGFGVLGVSSFQAVKMIGLMVSYTLLFALICDLVLLPALIVLFYRDNKHKTLKDGIDEGNEDEAIDPTPSSL
jgi:predicted RND superfamily exporter protein